MYTEQNFSQQQFVQKNKCFLKNMLVSFSLFSTLFHPHKWSHCDGINNCCQWGLIPRHRCPEPSVTTTELTRGPNKIDNLLAIKSWTSVCTGQRLDHMINFSCLKVATDWMSLFGLRLKAKGPRNYLRFCCSWVFCYIKSHNFNKF